MICVDTSVWIAALRQPATPIGQAFRVLLDEERVLLPVPVRLELLAGAGPRVQPWLQDDLAVLPVALPTEPTWRRMEGWLPRAGAAGERFGFADLLIAALAAEQGAPVWSLDRAFVRMARLGFVALHPA